MWPSSYVFKDITSSSITQPGRYQIWASHVCDLENFGQVIFTRVHQKSFTTCFFNVCGFSWKTNICFRRSCLNFCPKPRIFLKVWLRQKNEVRGKYLWGKGEQRMRPRFWHTAKKNHNFSSLTVLSVDPLELVGSRNLPGSLVRYSNIAKSDILWVPKIREAGEWLWLSW